MNNHRELLSYQIAGAYNTSLYCPAQGRTTPRWLLFPDWVALSTGIRTPLTQRSPLTARPRRLTSVEGPTDAAHLKCSTQRQLWARISTRTPALMRDSRRLIHRVGQINPA